MAKKCKLFDRKPIIVQPWKANVDWSIKFVDKVFIRIELYGSDLKYWGDKSLSKIISSIVKFVRVDKITQEKLNPFFCKNFS